MDKKIGLEHTIRNVVSESIGVSGTDKYQGTMRLEGKIGVEHTIRNVLTKKNDAELIQEPEFEEAIEERYAGGQKSLKPTEKQKSDMETNLRNLPAAADAAARGFASSATFGAADHIAAAGDYAVKNTLGRLVGGKGTDYETEFKQEQEKTAKAKKEHPDAYTAGEWAPLALGGAKLAVSAAKAAPATIKAIPGAVKDFTKWYAKTSPIDTVKAGARALGGDIISNPIKYAKEIPATAKGMAKFGAGLEIADKSVGMPELVGGQGWKQGAIYDKEKRKEMFSPGGATKAIQDVGKTAADFAAPGSVEAGKAAVKGDWDKAGREATKAVVGATLVNPNLGRFVYDAAASSIAPKYSLTGEGGVSDRIYNKIKKIKESRENLNEGKGDQAVKGAIDWFSKAIADKLAKEAAAKAAKEAAEAAAKAAKGNPAPKQPAPEPVKEPYVDKPANQPSGPNVTPFKAPNYVPPYRPDTSPRFPGVPANPAPGAPNVTPKRVRPDDFPPPGQDPFRAPPPKEKPQRLPNQDPFRAPPQRFPDQNPFPDKPAEVKPKAPPTELPKELKPPPYTNPKQPAPAARPEVPGTFPAKPKPAETKPIEDPVPVEKPVPIKKKTPEEPAPETAPEKRPGRQEKKGNPPKREEPKKRESKEEEKSNNKLGFIEEK
jgi:hypothetical protein